jgi:hypothetical protein
MYGGVVRFEKWLSLPSTLGMLDSFCNPLEVVAVIDAIIIASANIYRGVPSRAFSLSHHLATARQSLFYFLFKRCYGALIKYRQGSPSATEVTDVSSHDRETYQG